MMTTSDGTDDVEHLSSVLSRVVCFNKDDLDSEEVKGRRTVTADWLVRLYEPQEIAEMAVKAADLAWIAYDCIKLFGAQLEDLMQVDESLKELRHEVIEPLLSKVAAFEGGMTALKENARKGAHKKHQNDPKQAAKRRIHELWKQWRRVDGMTWTSEEKIPSSAPKFADFARKQEPLIESARVIVGWVRVWDRQRKSQR